MLPLSRKATSSLSPESHHNNDQYLEIGHNKSVEPISNSPNKHQPPAPPLLPHSTVSDRRHEHQHQRNNSVGGRKIQEISSRVADSSATISFPAMTPAANTSVSNCSSIKKGSKQTTAGKVHIPALDEKSALNIAKGANGVTDGDSTTDRAYYYSTASGGTGTTKPTTASTTTQEKRNQSSINNNSNNHCVHGGDEEPTSGRDCASVHQQRARGRDCFCAPSGNKEGHVARSTHRRYDILGFCSGKSEAARNGGGFGGDVGGGTEKDKERSEDGHGDAFSYRRECFAPALMLSEKRIRGIVVMYGIASVRRATSSTV